VTKLRVSAVNPGVSAKELIASIVPLEDLTEAEVKPFVDKLKTETPPIYLSSTSKEFIVKLAAVLERHGFAVEVYS